MRVFLFNPKIGLRVVLCAPHWLAPYQLWWATMRGILMAMRVVKDEEDEGGKATGMVTRVAGNQWQW
jgi:hypothetical protein